MRRRTLLSSCCGAVLVGVLGGCASRPAGTATNDVSSSPSSARGSSAVSKVAAEVVGRLGTIGQITSVATEPASVKAAKAAGVESGTWVTLTSSATGYLPQEKARWISNIIISEVWKLRHDAGDDTVVGGSLTPMKHDGDVLGDGVNLTITPGLKGFNFTTADGVTPAKLVVPDQAAYTSAVKSAAASAGLRVTSVHFTESAGSVVQIEEVTDDPIGFLKEYGNANPGLTLDTNDVEGAFLVVHDDDGSIVITSVWSTGSKSGEGGPGPKYGRLAGEATSEAATPTPSGSSS